MGLMSMLGRGSARRRFLFAAGALAAYAWRRRSQARRGAADQSERTGERAGARDASARGGDRSIDEAGDGHAGAGITSLPPASEDAEQASLPPRGQRKPGMHA
jgi:hypothetical protein